MLRISVLLLIAVNLLLLVVGATRSGFEHVAEETPVGVTVAESGYPRIRLLSELAAADDIARNMKCFTVGPFDTLEALEAVRASLVGVVESSSARDAEIMVDRGYRVFHPPLENQAEADALAAKILGQGLTDVSVFSNGAWNNSISLGYFQNRSNALARAELVRQQGFKVEIVAEQESQQQFWLDYMQVAGARYGAHEVAEVVAPELHRPVPCVSVSEEDAPGLQ